MRRLALAGLAACLGVAAGAVAAPAGVPCGRDVQNMQPEFSPDGSLVVFASGGMGGCSAYGRLLVTDSGGGAPRALLPPPAVASEPRFSPDGTSIAATISDGSSATHTVAVVTLAGERRDLAAGKEPSWSPDGTQIAFTRDGDAVPEVWAIRADGSDLRRIGAGSGPVWSPDGRQIAVRDIDAAIVVIGSDGSGRRRIADDGYYFPGAWSPDGLRFALLAGDGDVVRVVDVDTGAARSYRVPAQAYPLAWSAAGSAIALRGGASLATAGGTIARPFHHWDVLAVSRDWTLAAVAVGAGRYFSYEGNDLYVADRLGSGARLVSPRRCAAARSCQEGDDGPNTLRSTRPNSWLRGLAGSDSLIGSSGYDRIEGAFGDDLIVGNGGNDHLFGDVGNDRILGGRGDDLLDGGPGDDVLVSGGGRGRIFGGSGNDRIDARLGNKTLVYCGDGIDTVLANRTVRVDRDCEHVRIS